MDEEDGDMEFYCETCEQGWSTQEGLDVHLSEHEVCGTDGCSFSAHPKIVKVHLKFQHSTGLFKRIYNADGLEQWKAERRKNYPTVENVQRKLAEQQERESRGELIKESTSTFAPDNRKRKKNNIRTRNSRHSSRKKNPRLDLTSNEDTFYSTAFLNPEEAEATIRTGSIEDEELKDELDDNNRSDDQCIKLGGALGLLMNAYDSESELTDDEKEVPKHDSLVKSTLSDEDDEPPEEVKIVKPIEEPENEPSIIEKPCMKKVTKKVRKSRGAKPTNRKYQPRPMRRPSLLEKLLAKEIRQERNYILQCIRFIVDNNYFDSQPFNKTDVAAQVTVVTEPTCS